MASKNIYQTRYIQWSQLSISIFLIVSSLPSMSSFKNFSVLDFCLKKQKHTCLYILPAFKSILYILFFNLFFFFTYLCTLEITFIGVYKNNPFSFYSCMIFHWIDISWFIQTECFWWMFGLFPVVCKCLTISSPQGKRFWFGVFASFCVV